MNTRKSTYFPKHTDMMKVEQPTVLRRLSLSMVEMALKSLSEKNVVELDDERRAAMVSNLMVVLCGERDTQPVVNTGTLYS